MAWELAAKLSLVFASVHCETCGAPDAVCSSSVSAQSRDRHRSLIQSRREGWLPPSDMDLDFLYDDNNPLDAPEIAALEQLKSEGRLHEKFKSFASRSDAEVEEPRKFDNWEENYVKDGLAEGAGKVGVAPADNASVAAAVSATVNDFGGQPATTASPAAGEAEAAGENAPAPEPETEPASGLPPNASSNKSGAAPLPVPEPAAASKALFNCTAGHENWKLGWSPDKIAWCCKEEGKGCEEAGSSSNESSSLALTRATGPKASEATNGSTNASRNLTLSSPASNSLPSEVSQCEDTPDWANHADHKKSCGDYQTSGWCNGESVVPGQEMTVGAMFNYPEQNCCSCGKQATLAPTDATTTPTNATPAPMEATLAPTDATPTTTITTSAPTEATLAPTDATPTTTITTSAPTEATPSPTSVTPTPTDAAPAPMEASTVAEGSASENTSVVGDRNISKDVNNTSNTSNGSSNSSLEGSADAPVCSTGKTAMADAGSWMSAISPPGVACVFGVDARDEGEHCVIEAPGSAYGAFGWCYTAADGSSWGSCDENCPLVGPHKILARKIDELKNRLEGSSPTTTALPEAESANDAVADQITEAARAAAERLANLSAAAARAANMSAAIAANLSASIVSSIASDATTSKEQETTTATVAPTLVTTTVTTAEQLLPVVTEPPVAEEKVDGSTAIESEPTPMAIPTAWPTYAPTTEDELAPAPEMVAAPAININDPETPAASPAAGEEIESLAQAPIQKRGALLSTSSASTSAETDHQSKERAASWLTSLLSVAQPSKPAQQLAADAGGSVRDLAQRLVADASGESFSDAGAGAIARGWGDPDEGSAREAASAFAAVAPQDASGDQSWESPLGAGISAGARGWGDNGDDTSREAASLLAAAASQDATGANSWETLSGAAASEAGRSWGESGVGPSQEVEAIIAAAAASQNTGADVGSLVDRGAS